MNFNSVEFDRINRVQFDTFRSEKFIQCNNRARKPVSRRKNHGAWGRLVVLYGRPNSKGSYAHVSALRVSAAHHARAAYAQVTMPAARAVPTLHATAAPGLTPGVTLKQRVARRLSVGIRIVTVVVLVFSANAIVAARSCMRTLLHTVLRS